MVPVRRSCWWACGLGCATLHFIDRCSSFFGTPLGIQMSFGRLLALVRPSRTASIMAARPPVAPGASAMRTPLPSTGDDMRVAQPRCATPPNRPGDPRGTPSAGRPCRKFALARPGGVSARWGGVTSEEAGWLGPDAAMTNVHDAVHALLGPAIAEHVVSHVGSAGRVLGDWMRGALVSLVLRDEGIRRYSERRRGLVPFGRIDMSVWRNRRDLSRRNAFLSESD